MYADPIPRYRPLIPSFLAMTVTPWKTPRYFFTAMSLDCNSPCNCSLILTVSKGWVAVTAPQAAMPPAMNAPIVVDIFVVICWLRKMKIFLPPLLSRLLYYVHLHQALELESVIGRSGDFEVI